MSNFLKYFWDTFLTWGGSRAGHGTVLGAVLTIYHNFNFNFQLQHQLQMLRWYDMFLLHFLPSTKVCLAYFFQIFIVHCKKNISFFLIDWNSKINSLWIKNLKIFISKLMLNLALILCNLWKQYKENTTANFEHYLICFRASGIFCAIFYFWDPKLATYDPGF